VFVIGAISGAARSWDWHGWILDHAPTPSFLMGILFTAYLLPVLLWDIWCRPRRQERRRLSGGWTGVVLSAFGLMVLSTFFCQVFESFTGPFADYGERPRPWPAWLIREYVEEFLVFACGPIAAFFLFAAVRLCWWRVFLFYHFNHKSRRWSASMATLLGGLVLIGMGKVVCEFVRDAEAGRTTEPLPLLLMVCTFAGPLAASLLGLWNRPWTMAPLVAALSVSVVMWTILGMAHVVRFSGVWMFDWTLVVYAFFMVAICVVQLLDAARSISRKEQPTKTDVADKQSEARLPRVYPWWVIPVIVIFLGLEGYFSMLVAGTQEISQVLLSGFLGATFFLCVGIRCIRTGRQQLAGNMVGLAVLCGMFTVIALGATKGCPQWAMDEDDCRHRLYAIWTGLEKYHEGHGSYPPASTFDEQGKPIASWRTLLLPYLDEKDVSDAYQRNEAWDSASNLAASQRLESTVFRCPATGRQSKNSMRTDYLAIVGENAFWLPNGECRRKDEIANPETTAVLIEVIDSDIRWSEPRDVRQADLASGTFPWSRTAAHGRLEGCFVQETPFTNVLFADGSVKGFGGWPNQREIANLTSFDGSYPMKEYKYSYCFQKAQPLRHQIRVMLSCLWAASFGLIFVFTFLPVSTAKELETEKQIYDNE